MVCLHASLAEWFYDYVKVFFRHNGFAVNIDDFGLFPDDFSLGGLVNVDFRSFVHLFVNHVAAHDGKFQWIGFAHHAKVDFAVLQAGVGRNRDVVALFVGIGKRNEHSFGFDGLVGHDDFVVLLAVSDIIPDDIFHIGVETTAWVVGIIFGNLCVEACSGDAD